MSEKRRPLSEKRRPATPQPERKRKEEKKGKAKEKKRKAKKKKESEGGSRSAKKIGRRKKPKIISPLASASAVERIDDPMKACFW